MFRFSNKIHILFLTLGYILVIALFAVFVIINGSIVVGDKSAHEAALHLPQVNLEYIDHKW